MKIELLSIDGLAAVAEGWRLSREVDVPVEWQEVYTLDCPVTELASCLIHLRDLTVLEREIFASSRTHVMWARTSFVDDPTKYRLPQDMMGNADSAAHARFKTEMIDGRAGGLHQDEWRQSLPVMSLTCFTLRIGFRDLVKFAKYFYYLAAHEEVYSPLARRFGRLADQLQHVVDKFTGSRALTKMALDAVGLARFLHEGGVSEYPVGGRYNFYNMGIVMPFWLRAHFVRHRPLSFVDDLFRFLKREDVMEVGFRETITMEIAASIGFWHSMLGKRSCWLTQSNLKGAKDPWAAFIEKFSAEPERLLPCAGGTCPFDKDATLREEGRDPGCPCPRHLQITGKDPEPWRAELDQALVSRPAFYRRIVEEIRA